MVGRRNRGDRAATASSGHSATNGRKKIARYAKGRAAGTDGNANTDANDAPTAEMPAVGPNERAESASVRDDSPSDGDGSKARGIPEAAVARLAVYLRVLTTMSEQGAVTVSSEELSHAAGVNSAKLRKDLSYLGSYGVRGVGYEVEVLTEEIERILGLTRQHKVAVVGIGNLGHALANYGGFPGRGFPVTALFDVDADLLGVHVGGIPVRHLDEIPAVCAERQVSIGVIATPPGPAQVVCDRLVAGGVGCILNFAPVVLQAPEHVEVRKVDLAVELQMLSFHVASRENGSANADGPVSVTTARSGMVSGPSSGGGLSSGELSHDEVV